MCILCGSTVHNAAKPGAARFLNNARRDASIQASSQARDVVATGRSWLRTKWLHGRSGPDPDRTQLGAPVQRE